MPAFKCDLQGVLADQRNVSDPQLFSAEPSHAREPTRCAGLAAALGAWTRPSELLAGIRAVNSVLPNDFHHLTLAVDVDGGWKRVWV